jgi:hypothetical protein
VRHAPVDEQIAVNTQDGVKQIDPPLREYFPRTSAVSRREITRLASGLIAIFPFVPANRFVLEVFLAIPQL